MTDYAWPAVALVASVLLFVRTKPRPRVDAVDVTPLVVRLDAHDSAFKALGHRLDTLVLPPPRTVEAEDYRREARQAVAAAEGLYPSSKSGQDKARAAVEHLRALFPELSPGNARMIIEAAVAERKG